MALTGILRTYTDELFAYGLRQLGDEYYIFRVRRHEGLVFSDYLHPCGWRRQSGDRRTPDNPGAWMYTYDHAILRWETWVEHTDVMTLPKDKL